MEIAVNYSSNNYNMQDWLDSFGKIFSKQQDPVASALQKKKIKYINCSKQPSHSAEQLNYVCLDSKCPQKGLVCSLCKHTNHPNHPTLPLKLLLDQLIDCISTPSQPPQPHLTHLQTLFNKLLGNLSNTVQKLAQAFKSIEASIIQQYTAQRNRILQRYQTYRRLPEQVEVLMEGEERGREEMRQLVDAVTCGGKGNLGGNLGAGKYRVEYEPEKIVKGFEDRQKEVENVLFQVGNFVTERIKDVEHVMTQGTGGGAGQVGTVTAPMFRFTDGLRAKSIILSERSLVAKQTESSNKELRFAIIEPSLPLHCKSKISFKVKNLANWIGIGICFKNVIVSKGYKFVYDVLGHGSYLMSTNGYIWSTSDASDNIKMKGFSFLAGATVTVEFDPVNKKLVYTHEGNNMTFEQNIELGKSAVGNIHFCANLCSKDDEIRIV